MEQIKIMEELNKITYKIIGCAYEVHSVLGPGLLESAYRLCLANELLEAGLSIEIEKPIPLTYKGTRIEHGYRMDILVNEKIILELKCVECLSPIHEAQLLTYLKLSNLKLGLLINFNVLDLKKGIKRMIL